MDKLADAHTETALTGADMSLVMSAYSAEMAKIASTVEMMRRIGQYAGGPRVGAAASKVTQVAGRVASAPVRGINAAWDAIAQRVLGRPPSGKPGVLGGLSRVIQHNPEAALVAPLEAVVPGPWAGLYAAGKTVASKKTGVPLGFGTTRGFYEIAQGTRDTVGIRQAMNALVERAQQPGARGHEAAKAVLSRVPGHLLTGAERRAILRGSRVPPTPPALIGSSS